MGAIILYSFKKGKYLESYPSHQYYSSQKRLDDALSDADSKTSGLFTNRGGIGDLHLLELLFAICQKSAGPSFLEVFYLSGAHSTQG